MTRNKKLILAAVAITAIIIPLINVGVSANNVNNYVPQNEATLTIDFDNGTYAITQVDEDGIQTFTSWNGSVELSSSVYTQIRNFLNIDLGNLKVTNHAGNPGSLDLQAVNSSGNVVGSAAGVAPGETVTINVTLFSNITLKGKPTVTGSYSLTLKW